MPVKSPPLQSSKDLPDDAATQNIVKRSSSKSDAVTMRDVANLSGFSPATVSIVLNNAPLARYIAPATKKKIEESARKLGYRPNAMARFLRSKRTNSVGVMFTDITDPFCTPILRGIENSLFQDAYVPILADAHNQRNRFERYLELLLERHVEALIVVANWLVVDIHLLADFSKRNIPAATIGWELPGDTVSSVMVDNEGGGRLALEHLHKLGHRKIAFIRGPKKLIDSGPRWKGIQKFAHAAGLEIDSNLTMQLPEAFDPNSGFDGGWRDTGIKQSWNARSRAMYGGRIRRRSLIVDGRSVVNNGAPAARDDG